MKSMLGRLPFIVCVVAVVLLHQAGESLLFGVAVVVAFANLLSSQLTCALGGCRNPEDASLSSDPVRIVSLVNRISGITGAILCIYVVAIMY